MQVTLDKPKHLVDRIGVFFRLLENTLFHSTIPAVTYLIRLCTGKGLQALLKFFFLHQSIAASCMSLHTTSSEAQLLSFSISSEQPPENVHHSLPIVSRKHLDHRDNASIHGAMVSGRRAGEAVLADLER